jgi:subtilisin
VTSALPRRRQYRATQMLAVAALAVGTAAFAAPVSAAPPAVEPGTVPGAYIVTLIDAASPENVSAEHGRQHGAQVGHVYRHALNGYAARMSEEAARRVSRDARVKSVEPDRVVTTAAKPGQTTTAPPQTLPTGITRTGADTSSTLSGNGSGAVDVDVAVIDTGIDLKHPDLNVVGGKNCVSGTRSYADGHGHGTHVAGTIAAKDDAAGVVGVAPGARLWAVRVLDDTGSGTRSAVMCGIDWVTANASTIEVANMSLGGSGTKPSSGSGCSTDDAYHDAICRSVAKGVTYVAAAGNSATDAANTVPAAYDEVITVSALADFDGLTGGLATATCRTDADDTFASFSNYGTDVDLIAPGVCINSTWLGGGYKAISGTSMAAPHVAGAAALYLSAHVGAAPATVQATLLGTGGVDWSNDDDPDGIKEPLLNVSPF